MVASSWSQTAGEGPDWLPQPKGRAQEPELRRQFPGPLLWQASFHRVQASGKGEVKGPAQVEEAGWGWGLQVWLSLPGAGPSRV